MANENNVTVDVKAVEVETKETSSKKEFWKKVGMTALKVGGSLALTAAGAFVGAYVKGKVNEHFGPDMPLVYNDGHIKILSDDPEGTMKLLGTEVEIRDSSVEVETEEGVMEV